MAEITIMKTPAELKLGEQFKALASAGARAEAFAAFTATGLPHRRIEAWHYTDLRTILRDPFPPAPAPSQATLADLRVKLGAPSGVRLVLVDGTYVTGLSSLDDLPLGATVTSLLDGSGVVTPPNDPLRAVEALGRTESVLALNAAFLQGGATITVAAGIKVTVPVEIVMMTTGATPSAQAARVLVDVGAGSAISVAERHINLGGADLQANHAVLFAVGDGAALDHVCAIEGSSDGSLHVGTVLARIGADATLFSFTLSAARGLVRRQTFVEFAGERSTARLNGVTLLEGRAHSDTTLQVTHTAAHCESREYYKTILDDESTGVYQGKVVVAPGAQKTDGKMLSKAIFLADGASMFNKPELEIFADDVVCGHGATVGNLDEDQLFYLRARGIPIKEAQSLLLNAFAADAIEDVADEAQRQALSASIEQWLARRHL